MIRRSPTEAAVTAIITLLRGSTGVTGLATGGIWNNVPQGTSYPLIEVRAVSGTRQDTHGRYGADTMVDVKIVSQAQGDQEGVRIRDQAIRAANAQRPTVNEHTVLGIRWDQDVQFEDVINAVRTRYFIATFRVWTEQSST